MKHWTRILQSQSQMRDLAKSVAAQSQPGACIFLQGNLGAGKTTFCQGFLKSLGFLGNIKSPTYTLVEAYELPQFCVYHFDLYRLRSAHELIELGLDDYFTDDSICLIEWPEYGAAVLPPADLVCQINTVPSGHPEERVVTLNANTALGELALQGLPHA